MNSNLALRALLETVFDGARDGLREQLSPEEYESIRQDFVFHMLDWGDDLDRLRDVFLHPEKYDENSASQIVIGALYHVIPHLNSAGRLLLDGVEDPFAAGDSCRLPSESNSIPKVQQTS